MNNSHEKTLYTTENRWWTLLRAGQRFASWSAVVLELAVAAGCRYIVTHNLRDFRGTETWGVEAVTPADFLKLTAPKA